MEWKTILSWFSMGKINSTDPTLFLSFCSLNSQVSAYFFTFPLFSFSEDEIFLFKLISVF